MKKGIIFIMGLFLALALIHTASADPINIGEFADEKLQAIIREQYTVDEYGNLSDSVQQRITKLTIPNNSGVSTLFGISKLPNLTSVICNYNNLKAVDVSGCKKLEVLEVAGNQITTLTLGNNENLKTVRCDRNQIQSLDLGSVRNLEKLNASRNNLVSLDLDACPAITNLDAGGNPLTSLKISNCTRLKDLSITLTYSIQETDGERENSKLESLDVRHCPDLTWLSCSEGGLKTLQFSGCANLKTVNCAGNQLSALDASGCSSLSSLWCSNNQFTAMNMDGCTELTGLICENNTGRISKLDLSMATKLEELDLVGHNGFDFLDISNTQLLSANLRGNTGKELITVLKAQNCPKLVSIWGDDFGTLDGSGSPELLGYQFDNVESLLISGTGIKEIGGGALNWTGIITKKLDVRNCTSLTSISIKDYPLDSVLTDGCTKLELLNCQVNEMTEMDVSGLTALTGLSITGDKLAKLSLNDGLEALTFRGEALTELDISKCANLQNLICNGNNLEKIKTGKNASLTSIWCHENMLNSLDLTGLSGLEYLECESNNLTELNLADCKSLSSLICYGNRIIKLDLSGVPKLKKLVKNTGSLNLGVFVEWSDQSGDENRLLTIDSFTTLTADGAVLAEGVGQPGADIGNAKITVRDQEYDNGKTIKPELTVKVDGKTLTLDTDYTVEWKNNKAVGKATVIITGMGGYTGTAKANFKILPNAAKSPSVTAGKKKLTAKWKYDKKNDYDGYEIEYSLKKNFKGAKAVTIKKAKTTSTVIKGLKKGKTYYVRIRTWKKVSGKKYYSEWSKTLKKKVK